MLVIYIFINLQVPPSAWNGPGYFQHCEAILVAISCWALETLWVSGVFSHLYYKLWRQQSALDAVCHNKCTWAASWLPQHIGQIYNTDKYNLYICNIEDNFMCSKYYYWGKVHMELLINDGYSILVQMWLRWHFGHIDHNITLNGGDLVNQLLLYDSS